MKTAFKLGLMLFGFVMLCKISPLGAVVAIVTTVIGCCFRSRTFSHLAALLLHDAITAVFRGLFHVLFGRR